MLPIPFILSLSVAANPITSSLNWNQPFRASALLPHTLTTASSRPSPPPKLPPNRVRPGGGLNGGLNSARLSCNSSTQAVTALIPEQNPVLTTAAYPKLLFYFPDTAADVRVVTFSIFTQDEKTRVYETQFILPQTPGIVSVAPPELPDYALQENQLYRWYLKLDCQDSNADQAANQTAPNQSDLSVDGWIQRVTPTPERQQLIEMAAPDIWYDALANVASRLQSDPQKPELRQQWASLLRSIGMEHLAAQPFAGPIQEIHSQN